MFDFYRATCNSNDRFVAALKVVQDEAKISRINECVCKPCHYRPLAGGCAMTDWSCLTCGKATLHHSTNTPKLCIDCARLESLCRMCGADIDGRVRRRKYPKIYSQKPD